MLMAAGEHRIHRADEIAQVVGGRDQAGVGQIDMAFIQ